MPQTYTGMGIHDFNQKTSPYFFCINLQVNSEKGVRLRAGKMAVLLAAQGFEGVRFFFVLIS